MAFWQRNRCDNWNRIFDLNTLFVCLIWGLDWNLTCMKSCLVLTVDRQYSRRVLNSQKSLGICHRVCRKTLPKFRLQSSYRFLCYEQPIWKKQKSIKSHDNKKQAKTLTNAGPQKSVYHTVWKSRNISVQNRSPIFWYVVLIM